MKKPIIRIVIFSESKKTAKEFENAIKLESKYFKEETIVINDIEELEKVSEVKMLIYITNNTNASMYDNHDFENITSNIIVINKKEKVINNNGTKSSIARFEDDRAIAFSILYNYYLETRKK